MTSRILSVLLGAALVFVSISAMAQTTTYTTATTGQYAGDVVNSTYTFSGLAPGATSFTAILEQTQIPQSTLNSIAPPADFELELTSLTYVDTSNTFVGTGSPLEINLEFTAQPTIQQGGQPIANVTLVSQNSYTGDVTASNLNPITFTLASPVIFPFSAAQNLGNLASVQSGQPVGTWNEPVTNIHPMGQATSDVNGTIYDYNLNGTFLGLGGSLEVIYAAAAVPEPSSGWLALFAGVGLSALVVARARRA
jgi:hypothetical protein